MWFKNLYILRFEKRFLLSAEELHDELSNKPFADCSSTQRISMGWGKPLGDDTTSMAHAVNGHVLFSMMRQEKILPAAVIKDELKIKVNDIVEKQGRRVSAKEKKEIREDIEQQLLPRAFSKNVRVDAWIDRKGEFLIIDTATPGRAEAFVTLLRKTLGSLPVTLLDTEIHPASAMTQWLTDSKPAGNFTLGYECILKNQGDDKGQTAYKMHDLSLDEVQTNLKAGKFVSQLALEWDEKISFVLTENLVIKKLKFLDIVGEKLQNEDPQTHAEHLDIQFALMTGEVERLLGDLLKVLSGEVLS